MAPELPTPTARPAAFAEDLFDRLYGISADEPGVTRPSFSPVEQAAHDLVREAAKNLGLEIAADHVGNLYMTLPGTDRTLPRVLTGSHMDSVPHGGNFDGAAGVIAGLAAIKALVERGERPGRDITVMAIRGEEICWFPHHYLGSQAAFGLLPPGAVDTLKRSDDGRSLAEHMEEIGLDPTRLRAGEPSLSASGLHAFIELHIEQGPQLEHAGVPIGLVTAIRGNMRYRHGRVTGEHSHAGAIPRPLRRDAVLAVTELIHRLEAHWDAMDAAGTDFVCTVGELSTDPALHAMTKIPGIVRFTLDTRSIDNDVLHATDAHLRAVAAEITARRGVTVDLGPPTNGKPAIMDAGIRTAMAAAAERRGIPTMEMASGAGHDCATFASRGVRTGMIFVRNRNGSHNPDEAMDLPDFEMGAALLADTLAALAAE